MGTEKSAKGFVRVAQKIYNPIGFKKGYNFALCEDFLLLDHHFAYHHSPRVLLRWGSVRLHSRPAAIPLHRWQIQGRVIAGRVVLLA